LVIVEITERLVRNAGDLAARRALRGFDALHLASAMDLCAAVSLPLSFLAFDLSLTLAAKREGMQIYSLGS
jgi:hypothetical protein